MMTVITASVFLLIGAAALVYMICGIKLEGHNRRFRKYYIALASVYLSAVLLVWIITLINKEIQLIFIILSGLSVSFVFTVSLITVVTLMKNTEAIRSELKSKQDGANVENEENN
ncbi:MAG: hypothetical protein MJ153_02510 [Clostridia bacterium]|nr:hypothetical protein [Clostridia bacterium]